MTEAVFRAYDHLSGGVAAHPEEATELREALRELGSRVDAVYELHKRGIAKGRYPGGKLYCFCDKCGERYPCSTVRALDGVQAQGGEQ